MRDKRGRKGGREGGREGRGRKKEGWNHYVEVDLKGFCCCC